MQIDVMCRPSIFYKTDIFLKVEIMNNPFFQSSDCLCVKHADMKQVFVSYSLYPLLPFLMFLNYIFVNLKKYLVIGVPKYNCIKRFFISSSIYAY